MVAAQAGSAQAGSSSSAGKDQQSKNSKKRKAEVDKLVAAIRRASVQSLVHGAAHPCCTAVSVHLG
eukprot:2060008-Alexandrium_andersonii.AAC.1